MRGKIVSLRSVLKEDSPSFFKWINDEELVLNNGNFRPISKQEHEQWFEQMMQQSEDLTFSIIENKNNKLIGSCSLRAINKVHKNAELQIRIGEKNYQNKGMGSEAVGLLINYGFEHLNLKRIYLYVFSHNIRAIKSYEKSRFCLEGILRKAACINGDFIDINLMSILND